MIVTDMRPWTGPLTEREVEMATDTTACGRCTGRALWTWFASPSPKLAALGLGPDAKIGMWICDCGWYG